MPEKHVRSERNRKLTYSKVSAHRPKFSQKKRNRTGFLLRQIESCFQLVRAFRILSGEFSIYKNRIRDCEYEIYKFREVFYEKKLIDEKFLNDSLDSR